ncbi:hypothetical protein SynPROSU1_01496 [Synechococcus sp. PROS-U-1]|nr:hypothetical protein SynPROSU1_01496 [Synechococcus sp. PROS-U-1]
MIGCKRRQGKPIFRSTETGSLSTTNHWIHRTLLNDPNGAVAHLWFC